MKKLVKIITMMMMVTLLFAGCAKGNSDNEGSNNESETEKDVVVAVDDIVAAIKEQIKKDMLEGGVPEENFKDNMLPGFIEEDLKAEEKSPFVTLEINEEDLEEGTLLAPMINLKADQILVLKASDESTISNLEAVLQQVKESQIGVWEQYLPEQYEKVKNNIIKTNGKYLLYVTYDYPEKIEEIFDNMLK